MVSKGGTLQSYASRVVLIQDLEVYFDVLTGWWSSRYSKGYSDSGIVSAVRGGDGRRREGRREGSRRLGVI